MPVTPDSRLHQMLKSNTTISRIIEGEWFKYFIAIISLLFFQEWRRKWQTGSQWLDADIDDLYQDLHDIHPHVCIV